MDKSGNYTDRLEQCQWCAHSYLSLSGTECDLDYHRVSARLPPDCKDHIRKQQGKPNVL